jgi:hypothetical protein
MLPIGTPCKPMLPNPNGWGPAGPGNPHESAQFTANLCFQPCKPLGEVTIILIEFTGVRFVPENGQGGQCLPSICRFPIVQPKSQMNRRRRGDILRGS